MKTSDKVGLIATISGLVIVISLGVVYAIMYQDNLRTNSKMKAETTCEDLCDPYISAVIQKECFCKDTNNTWKTP